MINGLKELSSFVWAALSSGLILVARLLRLIDKESCNQYFGNMLAWGNRKVYGVNVEVEDPKGHLQQKGPRILVGNHQSNWDAAIFGSVFPKATYVLGKRVLGWVPIFGWFYLMAGNFGVDRKSSKHASETLSNIVERIKNKGDSVWIFPEGTRNRKNPKVLLPFKMGAFRIAAMAGVPILPMVAEPYSFQYKRIRVKILDPIYPSSNFKDYRALGAEVKDQMQKTVDEFIQTSTYS